MVYPIQKWYIYLGLLPRRLHIFTIIVIQARMNGDKGKEKEQESSRKPGASGMGDVLREQLSSLAGSKGSSNRVSASDVSARVESLAGASPRTLAQRAEPRAGDSETQAAFDSFATSRRLSETRPDGGAVRQLLQEINVPDAEVPGPPGTLGCVDAPSLDTRLAAGFIQCGDPVEFLHSHSGSMSYVDLVWGVDDVAFMAAVQAAIDREFGSGAEFRDAWDRAQQDAQARGRLLEFRKRAKL